MAKYKKMRDLVVNVLNQDFLCVRFGIIQMFSHLCNTFSWVVHETTTRGNRVLI